MHPSGFDIRDDTHSLDFKRNTNDLLARVRGSRHRLVLTVNGRADLVVQDAASYQKLLDHIDELEAISGIRRGLADVDAGLVTPLEDFDKTFREKHGIPRRTRRLSQGRR